MIQNGKLLLHFGTQIENVFTSYSLSKKKKKNESLKNNQNNNNNNKFQSWT